MTLTLTIQGREALDNGEPVSLELDRRGALIGRSTHADWSLPDAKNHISSRHCEISFRDGVYLLADRSTNGTFINGSGDRLTALYPLADGDRITVGAYEIVARLYDEVEAEARSSHPIGSEPQPEQQSQWGDWPASPVRQALPETASWADADPPKADAGWQVAGVSPPLPDGGGWDTPAPLSRPSAWSSEPREPVPPSAQDIWGQLAQDNAIDSSRGDFGVPRLHPDVWEEVKLPCDHEIATASPMQTQGRARAMTAEEDNTSSLRDGGSNLDAATADPGGWLAFLEGAGVPAEQIRSQPADVLAQAGAVLRQMVAGLVLMVDARARAKAHLGLQATSLELEGNNPLKFMRAPEAALLQLLEPPQRGFMGAARAVEDAYQDLQAHQMATLGAMRGALAEALARFSPAAIRERQEPRGWLPRLLPAAQDAALWRSYERDFEGVVRGADEAFMDVFAKEFRIAYEEQIAEMTARRSN